LRPVGFDVARLNQEIRQTYASVAHDPGGNFHFHRGPDYAARLLGYDLIELKSLPQVATAPFAGVGNPFLMDSLPPGAAVVDIGSGREWTASSLAGASVRKEWSSASI
jgi:hypothetical protein